MGEAPGAGDTVADDVVEGGQGRGGDARLQGEASKQDYGEIVHVAGLEVDAELAFGGFAHAVAAELDDLAGGEDVGWIDVLVDEIPGVQCEEGGDEAYGDLASLFDGEGAFAEDVGEAGVGGLHDGVDEVGAVELSLAAFAEGDEVGLMELLDLAPAGEDFGFVEVGFDKSDDGGGSGSAGGGEEGAASFGGEKFLQGISFRDDSAFVVIPKFHGHTSPGGVLLRQEARKGE